MVGVSLLPTSISGSKHILVYKLQSLGNPPFVVDCCSGPMGRKYLLTLTTTGAQGISRVRGAYRACVLACFISRCSHWAPVSIFSPYVSLMPKGA